MTSEIRSFLFVCGVSRKKAAPAHENLASAHEKKRPDFDPNFFLRGPKPVEIRSFHFHFLTLDYSQKKARKVQKLERSTRMGSPGGTASSKPPYRAQPWHARLAWQVCCAHSCSWHLPQPRSRPRSQGVFSPLLRRSLTRGRTQTPASPPQDLAQKPIRLSSRCACVAQSLGGRAVWRPQ